jgi:thiopeptide-type bacteriocin biosynthesis protein
MESALDEAMRAFAGNAPEMADHPAVVEAALAAAHEAAASVRADEHVTYARVSIAEAEAPQVLRQVQELVGSLREASRLHRWWWMEKQDDDDRHLRIRLHGPEPLRVDDLAFDDARDVRLLRYEPETALFGGPEGVAIAHRFHQVDTELLCPIVCADRSKGSVPPGVTVRVFEAVMRGAQLDLFERWDVWRNAARQRPLPPAAEADLEGVRWFKGVLSASKDEVMDPDGPFSPYVQIGDELGRAHRAGRLERTPRQIVAGLFIFHSNRARHGYVSQARLARAGAAAYDPMPADDEAG